MLKPRKRGKTYHVDLIMGGKHVIRRSLGTGDGAAANRLVHRLEIALSEGARSPEWPELGAILPPETFTKFAEFVGVKRELIAPWSEVRRIYEVHRDHLVQIDQLSPLTRELDRRALDQFDSFLNESHITAIRAIGKPEVERYKLWRLARVNKPNCSGATTLHIELSNLHHVFEFARENDFVDKNPIRMRDQRYLPSKGAEPFSADELQRLRVQAGRPVSLFSPFGSDWLPFLLARWTGMRLWDLRTLPWKDVHFEIEEIEHICHKNRKRVILPIPQELLVVLAAEFECRRPQPNETVLLNPKTGLRYTNMAFQYFVRQLGKRAEVAHAHPHRFRDTFAVDMLLQGNDVYYVAQALGDTILTVERHYLPYVEALRQRFRLKMQQYQGLEQRVTPASHGEFRNV